MVRVSAVVIVLYGSLEAARRAQDHLAALRYVAAAHELEFELAAHSMGSVVWAAKALGLNPSTLRRRMQKLGVRRTAVDS